jgi:hypothetical protein
VVHNVFRNNHTLIKERTGEMTLHFQLGKWHCNGIETSTHLRSPKPTEGRMRWLRSLTRRSNWVKVGPVVAIVDVK